MNDFHLFLLQFQRVIKSLRLNRLLGVKGAYVASVTPMSARYDPLAARKRNKCTRFVTVIFVLLKLEGAKLPLRKVAV